MSARLLQLSGVVVDLVHRVTALPAPGQDVESPDLLIAAGGGFNAAAATRRMGLEVCYGGRLGTGVFAEIAAAALVREGIALVPQNRVPMDQGSCVVLVDARAERTFVSHHGAEREVTAAGLAALDAAAFDWLLLSGYALCKPQSAAAFQRWLPSLGAGPVLLFDPGPVIAEIPPEALRAALDRADWLSLNRDEAAALAPGLEADAAARSLAMGRAGALVRVGAGGCWLSVAGEAAVHVAGFAVETIDTNGAGDAHVGAFIAAMAMGFAPEQAALVANAAAALSTTRPGPATAPDLETTRAFLADRGLHAGTHEQGGAHFDTPQAHANRRHPEETRS